MTSHPKVRAITREKKSGGERRGDICWQFLQQEIHVTNAKIKNTDWKKRLSGFTLFLQNIIKEIGHKNSTAHRCKNEREEEKRPTLLVGWWRNTLTRITKYANLQTYSHQQQQARGKTCQTLFKNNFLLCKRHTWRLNRAWLSGYGAAICFGRTKSFHLKIRLFFPSLPVTQYSPLQTSYICRRIVFAASCKFAKVQQSTTFNLLPSLGHPAESDTYWI